MPDTDRKSQTSGLITQRPFSTTSVNSDGAAARQAPTVEKQVKSVRPAPGHTGEASEPEFSAKLGRDLDPDDLDGCGTEAPWRRPGAQDHAKAPGDGKDSQYGAAPVRGARYRDGSGGTYGQGEGQDERPADADNIKTRS